MRWRHNSAGALIIFLFAASSLWAAKYAPDGKNTVFTQPDGTVLNLKVFGGQYYAETRTQDGHTIVYNSINKTYYYAQKNQDGRLVSTGIPAANEKPASLKIEPGITADKELRRNEGKQNFRKYTETAAYYKRGKERDAIFKAAKFNPAESSSSGAGAGISYSPPTHTTTGNYVGLCIVASFSDTASAFTKTQVDNFCNLAGYSEFGNSGSVRDYYYSMSNGLLTYTNVIAEVTLPHPKSYYNDKSADCGDCGRLLLNDAITALKSAGFDFSSLSSDGSGYVYATNVFFAGVDSGVWSYGLWPHQWNLASAVSAGNGKYIYDYQISALGTSSLAIGTFCHENGHLLCGYSDYYDYGYESEGLGYHCLMAAGNYCNNEKTPGPMSAYLKWKSGWITPAVLTTSDAGTYNVAAANTQSYVIKKSSTEYYLVENRYQSGWSAGLPGQGLAIWHVDESKDGDEEQQMTSSQHYECALVQADGRCDLEKNANAGDSTDYFGGSYTTVTDSTTPNVKWWSGDSSGIILTNISAAGSVMTFNLSKPAAGIAVTAPISGASFCVGEDCHMTWTSVSVSGNVKIELYKGGVFCMTIAASAENSGAYTWTVPAGLAAGSDYLIYVSSLADPSVKGCGGMFSIVISHRGYSESLTASSEFIGGGTATGWSGDEEAWSYTLPFSFPFYGASYSSVYVFSNGYLDFASSVSDYSQSWNSMTLNKRIAPYWADLVTSNVYIHQPGSDSVCIRWAGETYDNAVPVNFEVVLYKNGNIKFNYGAGDYDEVYPLIGLSAGDESRYDVAFMNGSNNLTAAPSELFAPLNGTAATAVIRTKSIPGAAGTVSPSGFTAVTAAAASVVSATVNSGYKFHSWRTEGDASVASAASSSTTVTVNDNSRVYAQYLYGAEKTALAWGSNIDGEAALDALTNCIAAPSYVSSAAGLPLSGVKQISGGFYHALALMEDGTVWAWGYNNHGQLGDGTTTSRMSPVQVKTSGGTALSGITAIAAGGFHSLATDTNGAVWAWGYNTDGRLGDGTTTTRVNPVQVKTSGGAAFTGATAICAGNWHSLAIAGGYVWAWGNNSKGQLGDGTTTQRNNPVQTKSGGSPFAAASIATAYACSYAVTASGAAYAWGGNTYSQLGDGTTTTRSAPGAVLKTGGASLTGVSKISANLIFAMALKSDGSVLAWGNNSFHQCGSSSSSQVAYATEVLPASSGPWLDIAAGYYHCAALKSDGAVWAWGSNGCGQLGDGTYTDSDAPVQTGGIAAKVITSASKLAAACYATYAWSPAAPAVVSAVNDFNGDGKSDLLLKNSGGTVLMCLMSGTSVLSSANITLDSGFVPAAFGDFNGDGYYDILARNSSSGDIKVYLMQGPTIQSSATLRSAASAWKIVGTGDLNGDGKTDIIWRNESTGAVSGWLMNGTSVSSQATLFDSGSEWSVVGVGDLNGDGKADLVWRNSSTGAVAGWLMNGLSVTSSGYIYSGSDPHWLVAGIGDLNGDGKADIVWRNSSTGAVIAYLMNGLSMSSWGVIYDGSGGVLSVASVGDFNGDGKADIAFYNSSTGAVVIYLMSGLTVSSSGTAYSGGTSWTVVSGTETVSGGSTPAVTSDFNGDGKSDLLWRNSSSGWVAMWLMSGALASDARIIFDSDKTWVPTAKGDFSGDGKADIVWQNSSSGAAVIWYMSGVTMTGYSFLCSSSTETVVCSGDFNGDGKADLLWRGSDASVYMRLMSGSAVASEKKIFEGGSNWIPVCAADFNGDGKADILWRETVSGAVAIWLMDGMTPLDSRLIFAGDGDWTPALAADFNGDGKADIAWRRNSDAMSVIWLMDSFTMTSYGYIYSGGDTKWKMADAGDYDGDGKADIVWRNDSSGQAVMYFMSGVTVKGWTVIFQGDPNWAIIK